MRYQIIKIKTFEMVTDIMGHHVAFEVNVLQAHLESENFLQRVTIL